MYKKKLEPLEILEKIKLSMNYDMGKTLNENRGLIVESVGRDKFLSYIKWCKDQTNDSMAKWERRLTDSQITAIAKNLNTKLQTPDRIGLEYGAVIENILNGIPTRRDFCKLLYLYNNKYGTRLVDDLDENFYDGDFTKFTSGLNNAFKYTTPEESNKKAPKKSTIDKSASKPLETKLKDSVYRQIEIEKGNKNARGFLYAVSMGTIDNTIATMSDDAVYTLKTKARADDIMNKYIEAKRTNQTLTLGDKVLNNYLNKMLISLSGNGGGFISLFEHLVNVRKGTLGDLKRLQELRYSQNATSLWDDIVKLPYNKTNLWLRLASSLDQMKINGSSNLKFERQPKKTLTDFSTNYPCLDTLKGVNVVGKNEGSKYFIFQKDANGTKYKFYWPILTQDKGMVFLSKSSGYYNKPNNVFNTSSDIDTGFKWSCSGSGGIGGSQVIIENKMGNLLEGNWTLPTKKKDTQVKTNTSTNTVTRQQGTKSKYQLCTGTYKKGCKDNEGIISKVQGCLGLGVDGKFGPKTEEVIYSKLNRNSFTKSDVDTLCKTGQISEPEIVEPKLIEPEVVKLTDLENI